MQTHPKVIAVQDALDAAGARTGEGQPSQVILLDDAVHTAAAAAEALCVAVGQIANSLVFDADGEPLLVLTSGAHRVDTAKVAAGLGLAKLKRANPEFVREHTGQPIGASPRPNRASSPGAVSSSATTGGIARQNVSTFAGRSRARVRARVIPSHFGRPRPSNGVCPDHVPRLCSGVSSTRARSPGGANGTSRSATMTAAYRVQSASPGPNPSAVPSSLANRTPGSERNRRGPRAIRSSSPPIRRRGTRHTCKVTRMSGYATSAGVPAVTRSSSA